MRAIIWIAVFLPFVLNPVGAQTFQGNWQGKIQLLDDLHYVFRIKKAPNGHWAATITLGPDSGIIWKATSINVTGRKIRFSVTEIGSTYEGRLGQDGKAIEGTWTIGSTPYILVLARATPTTEWREPPYKTQFVSVEKHVRLEVLDWGGSGQSIVLIPGSGSTAHVFGDLAAKLASNYRVYGITRRGMGASSKPPTPKFPVKRVGPNTFEVTPIQGSQNPYDSDRLGDDIVEVLDTLHIERPVLVGHSIGGEELSSVASRHPNRVAGLVYLDAFYEYAYSDGQTYDQLFTAGHPERVTLAPGERLSVSPSDAAHWGMHEYRNIPIEALAIQAIPHKRPPPHMMADIAANEEFESTEMKLAARLDRIEPTLPKVHIVRIPNASHWIFQSNEADVLSEMKAFISRLTE